MVSKQCLMMVVNLMNHSCNIGANSQQVSVAHGIGGKYSKPKAKVLLLHCHHLDDTPIHELQTQESTSLITI